MQLKFSLEPRARKLFDLSQIFGAMRLPPAMLQYPYFFGKTFQNAVAVEAYGAKRRKNYGKLLLELTDGNIDGELSDLLERLDISIGDEAFLNSVKERLSSDFEKYESALTQNIKRIFGFELPESAMVVLGQCSYGSAGSMLHSDGKKVVIGFATSTAENNPRLFGVLVHELMHGLVREKNIFYKSREAQDAEELLLEYSVPEGLLAWKIGITEKPDFQFSYENSIRRGYREADSKKIKEVVERYAASDEDSVIWDSVKEAFPGCINATAIDLLKR